MTLEEMQNTIYVYCESRSVCYATEENPTDCPLKSIPTTVCPNNLTDEQIRWGAESIAELQEEPDTDDAIIDAHFPNDLRRYEAVKYLFGMEDLRTFLKVYSFILALARDENDSIMSDFIGGLEDEIR